MSDDRRTEERDRLAGRLRGVARRILEEPGAAIKDAGRVLDTVIDGSDRARADLVGLVGREVRSTLRQLGVGRLVEEIVSGYQLEVHATFSLQPKNRAREEAPPEPDDGGTP